MTDVDHDAEFDEAFKGFGDDPKPVTSAADDKKDDEPVTPPKPAEEPKKDDTPPADPSKKDDDEPAPPADDKKPDEGEQPPKPPETPPEEVKPLTKDDVASIIQDIQASERTSSKELQTTTQEVLEAYYPDGLSNVLIDQTTGKELKTPQDVVDVTNGEMTLEQAAQWLMNEQYKLDQEVASIKKDAEKVAETTINFKNDGVAVLQKYQPLFEGLKEKYPNLQDKVFKTLMKQVKVDKEKGVILASPDVVEFYDDYLEPYKQAFEASTNQSATNPTTPAPEAPAPPTPGADDRLDEGGDGGATPPDDPNDFAQQVGKELAKGI